MSPDPIREQLSFIEDLHRNPQPLRPKRPERSSVWQSRAYTGVLLLAQGAVVAAFLHFSGLVQIPGVPPKDATSAIKSAAPLRESTASGPVAGTSARRPRPTAPWPPRATIARADLTPKPNPDDFRVLPLSKEDAGPEEDAAPAPEATRIEEEKKVDKPASSGPSRRKEARDEAIRKKKLAWQKKRDEENARKVLDQKLRQAEFNRQLELVRRSTPQRTIHRDPNGQIMGADDVYPDGSRVGYDRNGQVRHMERVLPDGTRHSFSRDNYNR